MSEPDDGAPAGGDQIGNGTRSGAHAISPAGHARQVIMQSKAQSCVTAGKTAHLVVTCTEQSCKLASVDANADRDCLAKLVAALGLPRASYTIELDLTAPAAPAAPAAPEH